METRDMIRMANQIAGFFHGSGPEAEAHDVAEHINKFWEPHMRQALFAHLDHGGEGLDATIIKAATMIKRPKASAPA
jgi:formate dehydrogenase subunit delta